MQELVGRLTALDPGASDSLKVIAYFDALVAGGVGIDALLRGAAVLSGAPAGVEHHGHVSRRDPRGSRPDAADPSVRSPQRSITGGAVWLEREGAPHANDEMVVERLALAIEVVEARRMPEVALEVAIDAARSLDERSAALARLRIDPASRVRAVALAADDAVTAATALVATRAGILRVAVDEGAASWSERTTRTGLGTWVRADHLPESWEAAIIAVRLSDPSQPVVDATDLGALLLLARRWDPEHPPDDVPALDRLDARSREVLRALVAAESIRSAAAALGMHHSTLQARHASLSRELGYDPRSALGRARFAAADMLHRLSGGG